MGPKVVACNMRSSDIKAVPENDHGGGGGDITVDSELSLSSENPVQNKVITGALNSMIPDSQLSLSSEKPVQNKVITQELNKLKPIELTLSWENISQDPLYPNYVYSVNKTMGEIIDSIDNGNGNILIVPATNLPDDAPISAGHYGYFYETYSTPSDTPDDQRYIITDYSAYISMWARNLTDYPSNIPPD